MKRVLTILFVQLALAGVLSAQSVSTLGTDFWVTFMKSRSTDTDPVLTLIMAGKNSCTGRVENPNTGWYVDFAVNEGDVTNIPIPLEQAYTTSLCAPANKGLHITSTDTIALFASNYQSAIFDISNVYPTPALSGDYMIQAVRGAYGLCCEFVIVATEDNTTVKVTPTADCTSNIDNIITNVYANSTFSATLKAGQSLMLKANSTAADFSGSTVKALDCKKVAVFVGGEGLQMPYGYAYIDLAFEQAVPTAYWGRHFVVTASMLRTADRVKVTSLRDSCEVKIDGVPTTTIMEGESYMFEMTPDKPAVYMETTQPVCTYLYFTGGGYGGYYGDPSSALINPIEQQIDDIIFPTFNTDSTRYHFVNIETETSATQGITLDGDDISAEFSPVPSRPQYSYARVEISHGSHRLRSTTGGFVAHIYGLGPHESYSYSAGSAAVSLNNQMVVNETAAVPGKEIWICQIEADLSIVANYYIDNVRWDFGDSSTGEGINVTHNFGDYGTYEVCAIVQHAIPDPCSAIEVDTVRNTVIIVSPESYEVATACDHYEWNGNTYTVSGDYAYHSMQTNSACDSIAYLILDINDKYEIDVTATTCNASYTWNDETYYQPGDYQTMLSSADGCDSLITLHLSFTEAPEVTIEGEQRPLAGSEIGYTHYQYSISTTPTAAIDSVVWTVDCPNWEIHTQGNGEVCDLFIHTYITDSVMLSATVYFDCGQTTATMWLHISEIGLHENKASHINITPNPNKGTMFITLEDTHGTSNAVIYDATGKPVATIDSLNEKTTLVVLDLPNGLYHIVVNNEAKTMRQNFIIAR